MRFEFLTSTPLSPLEGSGTYVALDGLVRGLTALGHTVAIRPLRRRSGFHTFDRWLYNAHATLSPPDGEVVVGVDLDGFLWARRRGGRPFVVMLKGIIADELRNERGWVRALLSLQARWERTNRGHLINITMRDRRGSSLLTDLAPATRVWVFSCLLALIGVIVDLVMLEPRSAGWATPIVLPSPRAVARTASATPGKPG